MRSAAITPVHSFSPPWQGGVALAVCSGAQFDEGGLISHAARQIGISEIGVSQH